MIYRLMDRIRTWVYNQGYRPKPGTILYSPSRAWSVDALSGFVKGLEKGRKELERALLAERDS